MKLDNKIEERVAKHMEIFEKKLKNLESAMEDKADRDELVAVKE